MGRAPDAIVADLVRLDWDPDAARTLVLRVADDIRRFRESPESRELLLGEAREQFFSGLLFTLLGAAMAACAVVVVLSGVTPWLLLVGGVMLWGMIRMSRGWRRWSVYSSLAPPSSP